MDTVYKGLGTRTVPRYAGPAVQPLVRRYRGVVTNYYYYYSSRGRTQSGMRLGAAVHSSSPAAAERPQWLYMGSRETSVCRLRRISCVVGRGANQSSGMVSVVGDGSVSSEVGESDSMESPLVMGWTPVSAMTNVRSGALWRAPPPLAVWRMAAWTRWHAALWRLMRRASWSGHSPTMWVWESGM